MKVHLRLMLALTVSVLLPCIFSGCKSVPGHPLKTEATQPAVSESSERPGKTGHAVVLSDTELENIKSSGNVTLTSDSYAAVICVPKDPHATLSKITDWLIQAKVYDQDIPRSTGTGIVNANLAPATLRIALSGQNEVTILPAYYIVSGVNTFKKYFIKDVLQVNNSGAVGYIRSSPLYDWLKDDQWKSEFDIKH